MSAARSPRARIPHRPRRHHVSSGLRLSPTGRARAPRMSAASSSARHRADIGGSAMKARMHSVSPSRWSPREGDGFDRQMAWLSGIQRPSARASPWPIRASRSHARLLVGVGHGAANGGGDRRQPQPRRRQGARRSTASAASNMSCGSSITTRLPRGTPHEAAKARRGARCGSWTPSALPRCARPYREDRLAGLPRPRQQRPEARRMRALDIESVARRRVSTSSEKSSSADPPGCRRDTAAEPRPCRCTKECSVPSARPIGSPHDPAGTKSSSPGQGWRKHRAVPTG